MAFVSSEIKLSIYIDHDVYIGISVNQKAKHIYIYIFVCECVCVCVISISWRIFWLRNSTKVPQTQTIYCPEAVNLLGTRLVNLALRLQVCFVCVLRSHFRDENCPLRPWAAFKDSGLVATDRALLLLTRAAMLLLAKLTCWCWQG